MNPKRGQKGRTAVQIILMAGAYLVIGRLGLMLAIPPGFSSPVWPAAGIALAGCLLVGPSILPGIWLGSFVLNLWVSSQISDLQPRHFILAALIALGTTLQSQLAMRLVGRDEFSSGLGRIFRNMFLAGPLSCLVAASIGVSSLYYLGIISFSKFAISWWTWWIGDSLGVLAILPLALSLGRRNRGQLSGRIFQQVLPIFVVFLGVILVFIRVRSWEENKMLLQLEQNTQLAWQRLSVKLDDSVRTLGSLASFYAASEFVSLEEFEVFTDGLIQASPEIQALEWIPKVSAENRPQLEKMIRDQGFSQFSVMELDENGQLVQAGERSLYFPVAYVEPYSVNKMAHGFDLYSNVKRREALIKSITTQRPVVTEKVHLLQLQGENASGFLLFYPVFANGNSVNAENLTGFYVGVFSMRELIARSFDKGLMANKFFVISDLTDPKPEVLYCSDPERLGQLNDQGLLDNPKEQKQFFAHRDYEIRFAGRVWKFVVYLENRQLEALQSWGPWIVLVGGFLFLGLLGSFLLWSTEPTFEIQYRVDLKTRELKRANVLLEGEIAQRRQVERDLIHARDAAEAATQAKSEFLANMSHEIRTPLNGIIGMTRLLLETSLSGDQREYASSAFSCGEALLKLVNDILDYSKIEAGKFQTEKISFRLDVVMKEVIEILRVPAREKNLALGFEIDLNIPSMVVGDPSRLRQVLLNLVNNGLKFTEKGSVTIRILRPDAPKNPQLVHFKVIDTGIGIPTERLKLLFQPFSQLDASTTRKYGGTGLGLAISRQLVAMMGGQAGVESVAGQGSEFWFELELPPSQDERSRTLTGFEGKAPVLAAGAPDHDRLVAALQRANVSVKLVPQPELWDRAPDGPFELCILWAAHSNQTRMRALRLRMMVNFEDMPLVFLVKEQQHPSLRYDVESGHVAILAEDMPFPLVQLCVGRLLAFTKKKGWLPASLPKVNEPAEEGQSLPLLVAEDNPINRRVVEKLLEKLGFQVTLVHNGREVVEEVQRFPYPLVIMDCQMPEMDGYEATRSIRALGGRYAKLPIIALTAHAMDGDREKCFAAGMTDYLSKPFNEEEFMRMIHSYTGEV